MSVFNKEHENQNHTFISLCEVSPGIIWAGGYSSGIYQIDKKKRSVSFFTPPYSAVRRFAPTNISVPLPRTAKAIYGRAVTTT